MSKFFLIKYKKKHRQDVTDNLGMAIQNIMPVNITNKIEIRESELCENLFFGVLNHHECIQDNGFFQLGEIIRGGSKESSNVIPDGSYQRIEYDSKSINFYCDRFESKSLWYILDSDKLIISNSQRLLISLKGQFKLNEKALSWFLSSGTLGFQNSWDSEIVKVKNSIRYRFDLLKWELTTERIDYNLNEITFNSYQEFETLYKNLTVQCLSNLFIERKKTEFLLPISGGFDSRLLLYLANDGELSENVTLINWGVKNTNFDDKNAALKISDHYQNTFLNKFLPAKVQNLDEILDTYIKIGEGRIDHFNAYSDNFKIFEDIFINGYKFLIRGDIPFTEGIDINEKMARDHIGIRKFTDYCNSGNFNLKKLISIQEQNNPNVQQRETESLIEWRDRLYIDYRIPIVISSFNDIINSYVETTAPMMSYSHFRLYEKLEIKQKGNKKHIEKLAKRLDKTGVPFNALPSIEPIIHLVKTKMNIEYLKAYLADVNVSLIDKKLIAQIIDSLDKTIIREKRPKESFYSNVKQKLSEHFPPYIKAYIKSKRVSYLDPVTLAYRIVMVDKINNMYKADSKILKQ